MEVTAKKRPTSVTVIGWIFIALAGLMILSSIMAFAVFSIMKHMGVDIPPLPAEAPGFVSIISQNPDLFILLQIGFAIFVLITSIQFLRLRSWARTTLEILSWLGFVYLVIFEIYWVSSWISKTLGASADENTINLIIVLHRVLGLITNIVYTAAFAIPIIVIIKFLRGKTIKEAVNKNQST